MYIDSRNMVFLHFGTSAEVLDHLEDHRDGWIAWNYFTAIPSCGTCDVAPSAVIFVAELQQGVSIGAGSLVFDCTLNSSIQIGARCVVTGVHSSNQSRPSKHVLLDSLPLGGASFRWTSGLLGDTMLWHKWQPKTSKRFWRDFLWAIMGHMFGWTGNSWCRSLGQGSCNDLWNSKLFPVISKHDGKNGPGGIQGIDIAMWLMGAVSGMKEQIIIRLCFQTILLIMQPVSCNWKWKFFHQSCELYICGVYPRLRKYLQLCLATIRWFCKLLPMRESVGADFSCHNPIKFTVDWVAEVGRLWWENRPGYNVKDITNGWKA